MSQKIIKNVSNWWPSATYFRENCSFDQPLSLFWLNFFLDRYFVNKPAGAHCVDRDVGPLSCLSTYSLCVLELVDKLVVLSFHWKNSAHVIASCRHSLVVKWSTCKAVFSFFNNVFLLVCRSNRVCHHKMIAMIDWIVKINCPLH